MVSYAQDYSALWEGHFSYLNVNDIVQGNGKVFAASENAVFIYNIASEELETITTLNGLSGDFISTIHYSEIYKLLIIGYENGLVEVYNELDKSVLTVVDILDKTTIPPDNKSINHFLEYNELIYISTDFGISVYNLERLEFGDTYFVGNGGTQIIVNSTALVGDYIYAACENPNGLIRALAAGENLIDYQSWEQIVSGEFLGLQAIQDKLFTTRLNNKIYEVNGSAIIELFTYSNTPLDIKSTDSNLIVTTKTQAYIYDSTFTLITIANTSSEFVADFTSAVIVNEAIFIGSLGFGVLKSMIGDITNYEDIYPNGPLRNDVFSVQAGFSNVWVTYGAYSLSYFPFNRRYGTSHLLDEWNNISYDSIQFPAFSLNYISINPFKPQQVFISSFQHGILEIDNDIPITMYNNLNSGLE